MCLLRWLYLHAQYKNQEYNKQKDWNNIKLAWVEFFLRRLLVRILLFDFYWFIFWSLWIRAIVFRTWECNFMVFSEIFKLFYVFSVFKGLSYFMAVKIHHHTVDVWQGAFWRCKMHIIVLFVEEDIKILNKWPT